MKKNLSVQKHLVISGKVQGVGFRHWLQNLAIQKNIFGWVKNKISGDVEALIIGKEEDVIDMIKICEKGPSLSLVNKVKIGEYRGEYLRKSFDIIKTD